MVIKYLSGSFKKMKRFFVIILLIIPIFLNAKTLTVKDINVIMRDIFNYHIEYKDYDEVLVARSFKIYISQFDYLKIYLLENEIDEYLNIKKTFSEKILEKLKKDDFSDYLKLNEIFKKAILRARENRQRITKSLILKEIDDKLINSSSYNDFAENENELMNRQKNSIVRFYLNQKNRSKIDSNEKKQKVFNLLEKKLLRNEAQYLEDLNEHLSSQHILKALSKGLDAHSYFFSEEEAEQMRIALEKQFEGVGLVLSESIDGVIVIDLIQNSPAKNSNLIKVNDILIEVNGRSVEYMPFDQVMKIMKDSQGAEMMLGFKRSSKEDSSFWRVKLQRLPISIDDQRLSFSYESFANGIIGKLELGSFYENANGITSEKDIKNAIKNLRRAGELKGLILDLRENAGGFLSQAIKVASLFIKNGVVVISKNSKNEIRFLRNIEGRAFYNGPLIVLTSKLSASASEIVAAALQDYGVAIIVGDETTFGKGSIQYQTVTDRKANYFFKVTVGKYYTVSGKTTQIEGVKADIIVPSIYSSHKIGERYLQYPLQADKIQPAYNDRLLDVDGRIKAWFKQNYLPNLQKKINFWHKILPQLAENSKYRLANDGDFQKFLKRFQNPVQEADEDLNFASEDFQMKEAINILKDMIFIEANMNKAAGF